MSHEMHHFSMGLWVLFLAYAVSVIGSLVGLICVQHAMAAADRSVRWRLTACAALSIGGVAIWLMHFLGMTGFDIPGSAVRYDLSLTVLSMVLSVGATGFGLVVVGSRASWPGRGVRLVAAGVVMGLAVSAMHYTGMWAIRIRGSIDHEPTFVIASIVIGVVAATAALWFSQVAGRWYLRVPAALLMGVAVISLHYTGMAGVRVHVDPAAAPPVGVSVTQLLFPAFGLGMVVLGTAAVILLLTPSQADVELDEQITRWVSSPAEPEPAPVSRSV
ncbi:MHYT domain-containing protein [Rhodococcus olei]|uniref:MHYT domain-containing protein n=1 Tax=Rhodococcus olei TaxID=2161675 RepID=A0ABP8PF23_9NOCA